MSDASVLMIVVVLTFTIWLAVKVTKYNENQSLMFARL